MINQKSFAHILVHCSIILFLTGCWDQIDIENHGFVAGIAIDKLDGEASDPSDQNQITLMNQVVIPAKLGGIQQGGGEDKPFTNLSVSGSSLFEIDQKISSLTARQPFYEHTKIIVFSEELAKEPGAFENLLDGFIRDIEMRRSTRVFIASGKASDILEIETESHKIPAMYIDSLVENNKINLELTEPIKLGDLHALLLNEDSYAISHAITRDNRIQADGVAVFTGYDNHLVGKLTSDETEGLNLIKRSNTGGIITFYIENHLMVYSIDKTKSSIKIEATDKNNIEISVHIDTKGDIAETFGSKSMLNKAYIEKLEKEINKKIEQLVTVTIDKAQNELETDFLGFSTNLREKHYSVWKQVEDNWDRGDNLFSKSKITVSASSTILSTGPADRTTHKTK